MRTRKQIGAGLLALSIGLVLAMAGCTGGKKEVTVKFADCPAAVQKALISYAEGAKLSEADQQTQPDGRIDYKAKGQNAGGAKIEIKVSATGQLLEFKSEIDER